MKKNILLLLISTIIKRIQFSVELRKYNNFTIAEYFRKKGAKIGEGCMIIPRYLGTEPYLVKIGNHVCISRGVRFHTHDGGTWIFREEIPDIRVFGPIVIEDNCLIGDDVHILPNVTIGNNSIIGPGSVVINDIPAGSIALGMPARRFGSIEKYKEKCIERWAIQKPHNLHSDSMRHYELIDDPSIVLKQLKMHLSKIFPL
jgi:acetyltransferase-like isoleucine patch superfamily enzyme